MSTIAAGTTSGTALVSTGNTDGTIQLQVNGTTPSVTLATSGAIGVGSTPGYGTSGQVLTSAGSAAAPSWATASSGMTLVSTLTASSSASLEWTGLTVANTYMLVLNTIQGSANQYVAIQFGTGAGPTYLTTGYTGGAVYYSTPGGGLAGGTSTSAYVPLQQVNGNTAPISGSFFLAGMQGNKPAATGTSYGGTATDSVSNIAASVSTTGPITAVKLYMPTGNLTSGTASLYKLAA